MQPREMTVARDRLTRRQMLVAGGRGVGAMALGGLLAGGGTSIDRVDAVDPSGELRHRSRG